MVGGTLQGTHAVLVLAEEGKTKSRASFCALFSEKVAATFVTDVSM